MADKRPNLADRIVKIGECWEWKGYRSRDGYGQLMIGSGENRKSVLAHRLMYSETFGDIPKGMCVCHSCDNPSCINPDHLWLGTHAENMSDMAKKGRASRDLPGRPKKLDYERIRRLVHFGVPRSMVGKLTGCSTSMVGFVVAASP